MTTIEQDRILEDYAQVLRLSPKVAAQTYLLDSLASVIAQLDFMSPELRDADWILESLSARVDYLVEEVPGLSDSPVANELKHVVGVMSNGIHSYRRIVEQGIEE